MSSGSLAHELMSIVQNDCSTLQVTNLLKGQKKYKTQFSDLFMHEAYKVFRLKIATTLQLTTA